jgi:hypothetical protein
LKQNSATLIPKMMPKSPRVDDKLTEFMTRLVSPPSRQSSNPMHSTLTGAPTGASGSYRTQASLNLEGTQQNGELAT